MTDVGLQKKSLLAIVRRNPYSIMLTARRDRIKFGTLSIGSVASRY